MGNCSGCDEYKKEKQGEVYVNYTNHNTGDIYISMYIYFYIYVYIDYILN